MMWIVDRIEGAFAVISAQGLEDTFDVPLAALPAGVREGDVLRLGADPQATETRRQQITDDAQGFEFAFGEGGFEFVIQRVVGDAVCDEDDGIAGESRFSGGDGMGNSGSCRRVRGESVVWEQSHVQGEESLVYSFLLNGVLRPR